jgi:hypothetical protein
MTHFKVDIQLPLNFNPEKMEKIGRQIPPEVFHDTYEELLKMAGGINTTNTPIIGSWISPKTKKRYNDRSIIFSIIIESEDKMTITNVPKIKRLQKYKNKLKKRFKQEEIFMIATRCTWI